MADKHVTGPIQVFVVGFDKFEATGRIMAELRRARKRGVIRLVDVIFVQKNRQGSIENSTHLTDLSGVGIERRFGADGVVNVSYRFRRNFLEQVDSTVESDRSAR